jgi:prepilin-type N-terminal cleavage/methylation domain-containing protein
MNRTGGIHPVVVARRAMRRRMSDDFGSDEAGFSLIELLVVVVVIPIVIGGIAAALLSVFNLQDSVAQRVGDSNDAQVGSATFNRDVQSAEQYTTQPTPGCGSASQTQLLGLEWDANTNAPGGYDTVVSYIVTSVTGQKGTTYSLLRQACTFGTSTTPSSTRTISHDIGASPQVSVTTGSAWVSTQGVGLITINVNEPGSGYSYALTGLPGQSTSTGSVSNFTTPSGPACNFATSGSGTYANQLCFADFTGFNNTQYPQPCQTMQRPISNTPFTLSFCISVSGSNVAPAAIPTYYNPSGDDSEAFLGNNGFYTGISGNPALYETQGGVATVYLTNIQVLDAAGHAASGWTLVTGDAESTDTNEWMVYQSNLNWSVLYNNGSADPYGNACYDDQDPGNVGFLQYTPSAPPTTNGPLPSNVKASLPANGATFPQTGTNSVLCESDQQLNKTGTLMLEAPEPAQSTAAQSLTVTMRGAGLEAMFLGVLL